jgi:hypothetical protein
VIDGYVVIFPTDDRFWFHNSRRVAGAQLSDAGRYVVRNLPAGDYRIAVSDDIDFNEWFDPEMLRGLVARSMQISLGEAEVKALALTAPHGTVSLERQEPVGVVVTNSIGISAEDAVNGRPCESIPLASIRQVTFSPLNVPPISCGWA